MSARPLSDCIEDIAACVVMADPAERDSFKALPALLSEAEQSEEIANYQVSFKACKVAIAAMAAASDRDLPSLLSQLCEIVSEFQNELRLGKSAPVPGVSTAKFVLPPWVDEIMFRDFLAAQKLVLEEIEGEILELEKGGENSAAALKRRIHTLKGEAGVVGLDALSEVCHGVEDFMLAHAPGPELIDRLLSVRDWVGKAMEAYAEYQLPEISASEILDSLHSPAPKSAPIAAAPTVPSTHSAPATATVDLIPLVARSIPIPVPHVNVIMQENPVIPPPPATVRRSLFPDPSRLGKIVRDDETVELMVEFLQEGEEGLGKADHSLMNIEREGVTPEMVNGLFRIFHTIKGVAGMLELKDVTALAHNTETMLNLVRQGTTELKGPVLDLTFDSTELARQMLQRVRRAVETNDEVESSPSLPALLERMKMVIEGKTPPPDLLPVVKLGDKLGEILGREPTSLRADVIQDALQAQADTGRRLGEELVARGAVSPKQLSQALRAQDAVAEAAGQPVASGAPKLQETIKVDLARVDSLVEMIGELVIVETMVVNAPEITSLSAPRVRTYLNQLGKITRDLQDVGMRMRMVPMRGVFQKMARMVRDLARKSGKQVVMEQAGEGTEMDRSMVEQISDPLVHMIRNSCDHGIEPAEDRIKAGKDPVGTVRLSAYHEGGSIVVEIQDDGRGLDREAILRKAESQGLIQSSDKLTEAEIFNLIFAPGFSTAKQITEISGRGVGMDVVKRNIEQMRGRVVISSVAGQGSTFKIVLPLTLAIIDGMLVACGKERYIIPTLSIVESIQPEASMLTSFANRNELVNVRGDIMPLFRLDRLFNIEGARADATKGLVVVVESLGKRLGLLVDDVVTQQQVVIKTLGSGMAGIKFIAGAAILSDGRVGLILNVEELGSMVRPDSQTGRGIRDGIGLNHGLH